MCLPGEVWVCFAVKEEAQPFKKRMGAGAGITILLTGMGRVNAERSLRQALSAGRPALVISSGFAGGLNPALVRGAVLFSSETAELESAIKAAGAIPARFHCAETVAVTRSQKAELWKTSGADAVEMESGIIRRVCQEHGIPSATVRVISDSAAEDLPLDFNALMTRDLRLDFRKLAWELMRSPGKVGELLRFQKRVQAAAESLGQVLAQIILKNSGSTTNRHE
jgi:adenosylhomocysteine nucleosidase